MDPLYVKIRSRAKEIARSYPVLGFYQDLVVENHRSRTFFETDPSICRLRQYVTRHTDNDLGHGLAHVTKVTIESGALFLAESREKGLEDKVVRRGLLMVQCAGLLHDIERKEKNHAQKGAEKARSVLEDYPLSLEEISQVCLSIENHEAFKEVQLSSDMLGAVVSDCLYDADKFRWGPDNFTDTVWHMVSYFKAPLDVFLQRFPEGMEGIERIKSTFRSSVGKSYGPGFIDAGLAIGRDLYKVLKSDF